MIIYSIRYYIDNNGRKKKVCYRLYFNQRKTYADIAEIEMMSIRDISAILKEEESRQQKYKDQQQQEKVSSQAYKLFSEGKTPLEVAITLKPKRARGKQIVQRVLEVKTFIQSEFDI